MQEIGAELRQIRESKGLTLEEVEQATKIRIRYLEAIEAGDLSALPGVVYARGFIKSYADYLEVDGQALLEKHGMAAEQEPQVQEMPKRSRKSESIGKAPVISGTRLLPQVVAAVGILAIVSMVYAYTVKDDQQLGTDKSETKTTDQVVTEVTPAPVPQAKPEPKPEPPKPKTVVQQQAKDAKQTKYSVTGAEAMTMVLKATSNCWLQITADGKVLESGIVKAGESRTWKANQTILLNTGASKYITIKINDQPVTIEGTMGAYTYSFQKKS